MEGENESVQPQSMDVADAVAAMEPEPQPEPPPEEPVEEAGGGRAGSRGRARGGRGARILERRGQGGLGRRAGRAAAGAEEVRAAARRVRQREGARGRRSCAPRPRRRSSAPTPRSSTRPRSGGGRPARRCSGPSPTSGPRSTGRRWPRRTPPNRRGSTSSGMEEAGLLAEADRRGQRGHCRPPTQRAAQALQQARQAEHAKLAARLPELLRHARDGAQDLRRARPDSCSPRASRPTASTPIHEAPIIEMALNAMRFEQAQQHALLRRPKEPSPRRGEHPARPTPTRVVPGPARRAGNRASDAARQVGERFRKSGGNSIADAAELIRLSGL